MQTVYADLLSAFHRGVDLIGHQVNCHGVMGAGLAKQIRQQYPSVYRSYSAMCQRRVLASALLGSVQIVKVADGYVANLFAQVSFGRDRRHTDYDALREALTRLRNEQSLFPEGIALPYGIGCGLAGGDWDTVKDILHDVFDECSVPVYLYKLPKGGTQQ